MIIRPAEAGDWAGQWAALKPVFRAGTTYAIDRDISEADARAYWVETPAACYVAVDGEHVLGTFYIKKNAAGGGAHVCNCGYVTAEAARGRGVAEAMCRVSQSEALQLGFTAMQFNMVLSTNDGALRLWDRLGFRTVGIVPDVFDHPEVGLISGHVMFRSLKSQQ